MMETENKRPKSRSRAAFKEREREKRKFPWKAAAAAGLAVAAVCVGVYVYKAQQYGNTYFSHTTVNGMDVSGKTAKEVEELISQGVKDYSLTLLLRDEGQERIDGTAIDLHTVFDGSLEEIIHRQNPYAWPRYVFKGPSYEIQTMIAYDEDKLGDTLQALSCMDEAAIQPPKDAYLSDYTAGTGYSIVPEVEGNQLDGEKLKETVAAAVSALHSQVNLEEADCYVAPSVRQEDEGLIVSRDARNKYVNITVTYTFGSKREVLDGSVINGWIMEDGGRVILSDGQISAYVKGLASKYNTAYTKRSFKTSYGPSVEVSGVYGWRIDQVSEAKALKEVLEAGESVSREPIYSQSAASHDGSDYGSTYAEVNLTAQHMFFYKDGKKVLESDFVSGNASKSYTTPPGIFSLTYKQRDAVLKGENYASPVKFWMPFNGGIGFHDASWRSSFGGSIYKSSGSHGCVNMPYASAKSLFDYVYAGMPVICYNLAGTESTKASQASGKETAAATTAAPTQAPAATAPAESAPAATEPAQTVPAATAAPTQAPAETTPAQQPSQTEISIEPVETGSSSGESGPAFGTVSDNSEKGPGVN